MENKETLFLGHTIAYWQELEKRAETLDVVLLLKEIAELHGKVGFYERRISEMNDFQKTTTNHPASRV